MLNRHLQEPFTMAKHPELLKRINELMIDIQLHHYDLSKEKDQDSIKRAQLRTRKPTWENVVKMLEECYNVINSKRENPVKY